MTLGPESRPVLPRFVRLRHDRARGLWVLLAPERVLVPDETSVEVLQLCDGDRTLRQIATSLAGKYDAPESQIEADIAAMLAGLAEKGFLEDERERAT